MWGGFNQKGTFSRLQVHEGVGFSLVKVYERLENLSLWSVKRAQWQIHLMAVTELIKQSYFVIYS